MAAPDEAEELAFASFWDKRYSAADTSSKEPTHEWFRGFESLKPWFSKHIFGSRPATSSPAILHLGSGDSVSAMVIYITNLWLKG
jgi:hypothetical protein